MLALRRTALVALVASFPSLAAAQRPDAASRGEEPCTPEGSAICAGIELSDTLATLDARLDRRHTALVRLVRGDTTARGEEDGRITRAVDTLHATWRRLRGDDCELHGALTQAGGTWPSVWATDCEVAATRARIATVDAVIRCITRMPADERRYRRFDCLSRLRVLPAPPRRGAPS